MGDEHNYRWKRCYETCDGRKHWAIVSDESEANRRVCSSLLVVEHEWVDFLGRRFQDCELPQRIIALLNADESHFSRSVTKMRRYKSPENGLPYSDEGIADLEKQLHEASRAGDSALLEMAAIALRRVRVDKQQTIDALTAENAELREKVADYVDTVSAMVTAATGTEDIDEQERLLNAAGPKPSCFIAELRKRVEVAEHQRDRALAAFTELKMVSLPPHDVSGTSMWDKATAAVADVRREIGRTAL